MSWLFIREELVASLGCHHHFLMGIPKYWLDFFANINKSLTWGGSLTSHSITRQPLVVQTCAGSTPGPLLCFEAGGTSTPEWQLPTSFPNSDYPQPLFITVYACMLSCFSCVRLFVTLWTVALQAPLSMGFSRQEYWSALPCPPPGACFRPGDNSMLVLI